MDEKCTKNTNGHKCYILATYKLYLSPGKRLVFRCTFHMAMDISKINLSNSELRTIQKVD